MSATQKGNCYLCGAELGKTAMKNHILKNHVAQGGGQECRLLKIEGADNKNYWLYVCVPVNSSLTVVDTFLRKIWLECCGHMSDIFDLGYAAVKKSTKLGDIPVGTKLLHEYDFGSTTQCLITVVDSVTQEGAKRGVRLLARNIPFEFECGECDAKADLIDVERMYDGSYPFLCNVCAGKGDNEMVLPVTNSPRMGVCGYCGELDNFSFVRPQFIK